jgi:predicted DNA-binding antitoxin AbrB/MazE fold protein
VYKDKVLKPLKELNLKEGEEVEIEIKKDIVERTFGVSKLSDNIIEEIIETTKSGE